MAIIPAKKAAQGDDGWSAWALSMAPMTAAVQSSASMYVRARRTGLAGAAIDRYTRSRGLYWTAMNDAVYKGSIHLLGKMPMPVPSSKSTTALEPKQLQKKEPTKLCSHVGLPPVASCCIRNDVHPHRQCAMHIT